MTGGIIQLVAHGIEDIFLTRDPQITFLKVVYRRHTNFSTEEIPQYFSEKPNWGKTYSCEISKDGDLMGDTCVVVTLPSINKFKTSTGDDNITKFAWARRIGHVLLKSITIEINGKTIDKHYGEWLNIWMELFGKKDEGCLKLIGDVPELTEFTNGKDEYVLYIPLRFWFCGYSGRYLPLIAMTYSNIKINIEINDFDNCYIISPTNYIKCEADIVNFREYEYIEQNVDGVIYAGIYNSYDIVKKRLYYTPITKNKLIGTYSTILSPTQDQKTSILTDSANKKYRIIGKTSKFYVMPSINETTKTHNYSKLRNINLGDVYLLVNFVFLDEEERIKVAQAKHEYLIEQLFYTPDITLEGANRTVAISIDHPCKFLQWIVQMDYIDKSNDHFNYTDSYVRKLFPDEYPDYELNECIGKNPVKQETMLINGHERLSFRDSDYFTHVQNLQYAKYSPSVLTNSLFFSLFPASEQPSGTFNTSQATTIEIKMRLGHYVDANNFAKFRSYGPSVNVLRIDSGLCATLFKNSIY
uniref:Major capsid protein N-terminal domain-containing protein n=1 Tax=viral metagenome TaxID=1070528 RepID=A0A6C0EE61_9ZZZZ